MSNIKIIAKNKKAHHNYHIDERWEAGIALLGTEVKALRAGKVNLVDGWVDCAKSNQAWLHGVHIGHYSHGNRANHDERRPRQLLLHTRELEKLERAAGVQGTSIVPIKMYFKGNRIKIEIALGKGKKLHDKREDIKSKDAQREVQRAMRKK